MAFPVSPVAFRRRSLPSRARGPLDSGSHPASLGGGLLERLDPLLVFSACSWSSSSAVLPGAPGHGARAGRRLTPRQAGGETRTAARSPSDLRIDRGTTYGLLPAGTPESSPESRRSPIGGRTCARAPPSRLCGATGLLQAGGREHEPASRPGPSGRSAGSPGSARPDSDGSVPRPTPGARSGGRARPATKRRTPAP